MTYNSSKSIVRSVWLFKCRWFDQRGRRKPKDDGYLKSVNIDGLWYTGDPFVLVGQVTKIFYLQDNLNGPSWRVVQKFEHRHLYDVLEKDGMSGAGDAGAGAYQEKDDYDEINESFTVQLAAAAAAAGVDDDGPLCHVHSNDDEAKAVVVPVQTSFTDTQVVDSDNDSDYGEDEILV